MDKIAWVKASIAALAGGAISGVVTGMQAGQVSKEQIAINAIVGAGAVAVAYLMKSPKK
jgi:hypothetical protein